MAYVLVDEEQFGELLASRAALVGASYFVKMGDSILVEGLGEVYTNPLAISMDGAASEEAFSSYEDELPSVDCE